MAKVGEVAQAIQNTQNKQLSPTQRLQELLNRVDIREKFNAILKDRAAAFISSIIATYNATPQLQSCDPMSIIQAAAMAASLDLPINSQLGFAAIVPYGSTAQFQVMWKGLVQLAQRTSQYKTMGRAIIHEGELIEYNRITGETRIDETKKKSSKVIGYVFYFRLHSGFEKYVYMTKEQTMEHGKKFSKSFSRPGSAWQTNFDAMSLKTVTKIGIGQWGPMSVEHQLQKAIQFDQAVVRGTLDDPIPEYVDANVINTDDEISAGDAQEPVEPQNGNKEDGELPLKS